MQPPLWKSRKFWLLIADILVSLILYFGAKYLTEASMTDIKFLIATLQPVWLMLIGSITYQNVKAMEKEATMADITLEYELSKLAAPDPD